MWTERGKSEMAAQFKAETDWHRTKRPCHTSRRALLTGDCSLRDRRFLVSVSVTVISVEIEVFYSVPDDMKSMHPKIWGRLWGLPPQRKTLIIH